MRVRRAMLVSAVGLAVVGAAVAEEPTAGGAGADGRSGQPRKAWAPIVLRSDDKPAFPAPPAGWNLRREGVPRRRAVRRARRPEDGRPG